MHPDLGLFIASIIAIYIFVRLIHQLGPGNRGFIFSFIGIALIVIASFLNYFEETPYGYLMLLVTDEAGWDFIIPIFGYAPGGLLFCFGFAEWLKTSRMLQQEMERRENIEKELTQALSEARQADLAKNLFFSSIGHELRTPLTAIIGFSDILASTKYGNLKEEQYSEYHSIINKSSKHLLESIDQLLELADSETKAHTLNEETVAMAQIARDSAYLMKSKADADDVKIEVKVSDAYNVNADKRLMRHIILTTLDAALQNSKAKDVVEIEILLSPEKQPRIKLCGFGNHRSFESLVSDFLPFDYGDDVSIKSTIDKGIGITLSKRYAASHGGSLEMVKPQNSVNKNMGAEIHITLPSSRLIQ